MEKKSSLIKDEIDFPYFFKIIKKSKILIIFVSIIFTLLGYLYQTYQPRELQLQVKIASAPITLFSKYLKFGHEGYLLNGDNDLSKMLYDQYNNRLIFNILSLDHLEKFVSEDKKIDNFKNFLKLKNISSIEYFDNKLTLIPNQKNIDDKYVLKLRFIFPKELDGSDFISNYVEFIKNKTFDEFKETIKILLEEHDKQLNAALEIAKAASIESPFFSKVNGNIYAKTNDFFYEGTKVLSSKISLNKKAIVDLNNNRSSYKIILTKSIPSQYSKSEYSYALVGFIFGIFLSIIIIFFKKYNSEL
jgi:LPS O-antigen subunit length determinant protein (WzzB/FepE family)